ncbi:hypothetical protein FGM00_14305 [Aggregatimonas sangjinii]|uniref:Uncharacterized protein n=1 Tax=Aggregatimonas sangjinii TaxID=2583587 RepID=A0A5B7SRB2_9FLAO|nr:hypothetical protein [Aggregatimonas sangjinii]QCX01225.1 hypothetical protein FGM00_14305 [Aggregatimonas sangjinii]
MSKNRSILQKVIDQVRQGGSNNSLNERTSVVASIIIALSGLILYLDKAMVNVDVEALMPDKFVENQIDPSFFIWLVGVTVSPLLIIVGSILKPYFYAYIVPIYCYVLQFYFILIDYSLVDNGYSYSYSFGITVILLLIMQFARKSSERSTKLMIQEAKEKLLKAKMQDATK